MVVVPLGNIVATLGKPKRGYDQANPFVAMNLRTVTRGLTVEGVRIPGSYLVGGTLRLGGSYIYSPGKIVDLSLAVGLTRDVPNLQFTVGVPLRFALWKPSSPK